MIKFKPQNVRSIALQFDPIQEKLVEVEDWELVSKAKFSYGDRFNIKIRIDSGESTLELWIERFELLTQKLVNDGNKNAADNMIEVLNFLCGEERYTLE